MLFLDGDGFDLDQRALGQRADLHRAARGAIALKIFGVRGGTLSVSKKSFLPAEQVFRTL